MSENVNKDLDKQLKEYYNKRKREYMQRWRAKNPEKYKIICEREATKKREKRLEKKGKCE